MEEVGIGILTRVSLKESQIGMNLFSYLISHLPGFIPEKYDDHEPISKKFDIQNFEETFKLWGNGFLWKRRKPKFEGSVWMGVRNLHDAIYMSVPLSSFDGQKWYQFLVYLCELTNPDLVYFYLITKEETVDKEYYKNFVMPFNAGLTTHRLRRGLPNLCWGTFFGPPYVRMIGKDKLATAPVARCDEIGNGVYLQLTERLQDIKMNFVEYENLRSMIKCYLGLKYFSGSLPEKPIVPDFEF